MDECFPDQISDEYLHLAHNCHADANCSNTKGSFVCMCHTGYSGDGVVCLGISFSWLSIIFFLCHLAWNGLFALTNQEAQSTGDTKSYLMKTLCLSTVLNYWFKIARLIKVNMHAKKHALTTTYHTFLSKDVNECDPSGLSSEYQHLVHICHDDANCTNTKGSYYCACLNGYSGSGENCTGNVRCKVALSTDRVDSKA